MNANACPLGERHRVVMGRHLLVRGLGPIVAIDFIRNLAPVFAQEPARAVIPRDNFRIAINCKSRVGNIID